MVKLLLISVVALFGTICAYKSGAPNTDEVCETMIPDHGAKIQPGKTFPYKVTVDKTSIKPGESVTIKITGSNQHPIRGFFVQARVGNTPTGHFEEGPEVQATDCLKGAKNAATHTNGEKKGEVKIVWTAPNDLEEKVTFRMTVVAKGDTYWVGHETEPVHVTTS